MNGTQNLETSKMILAQLGGGRFIAMTGSKNFLGGADSLSFKVGSNPKRVSHCRIVLNASDLYDVTFFKNGGMKQLPAICGVGVENLGEVFTNVTGLLLSL